MMLVPLNHEHLARNVDDNALCWHGGFMARNISICGGGEAGGARAREMGGGVVSAGTGVGGPGRLGAQVGEKDGHHAGRVYSQARDVHLLYP